MKVKTLNRDQVVQSCDDLFIQTGSNVDLVVLILEGGKRMIRDVHLETVWSSASVMTIKINRHPGRLRSLAAFVPWKWFPQSITNMFRRLESWYKSGKKPDLKKRPGFTLEGHCTDPVNSILVLDDAIDTGSTMYLTKRILEEKFPEATIKSAVLSWTMPNSIEKPDYYVYSNCLVRFPWSKDYKN